MKNRNKIVYYESGDWLSFTLKGSRDKIHDQIRSFMNDSLIQFNHNLVNVKDIDGIYLDKKNKVWWFMKYKYEKLFLIGGVGYLLLDLVNTGELDESVLIVSGSLITAGLLAKLFIKKRIRIKGKMQLRILSF